MSSTKLEKLKSTAIKGNPLPSPGSVSQKYSACVSEMPLTTTVDCISTEFLKTGPQLLLLSFLEIKKSSFVYPSSYSNLLVIKNKSVVSPLSAQLSGLPHSLFQLMP